jgi:hypothetical protein
LHVVPDALRANGMVVVTLDEAGYAADTPDADWIPRVAAERLVILTKDKAIRRNSLELSAVLTSCAFYFTLGGGNHTAKEMAEIILYHRPTIERLVANAAPPVVAQLNKHELLVRHADGSLRPAKRKR